MKNSTFEVVVTSAIIKVIATIIMAIVAIIVMVAVVKELGLMAALESLQAIIVGYLSL